MQAHGLSERQACRTVALSRSVLRYQARKQGDGPRVQELLHLAGRKPRWGFGKMAKYLKNEGHSWNHKRIRRVD